MSYCRQQLRRSPDEGCTGRVRPLELEVGQPWKNRLQNHRLHVEWVRYEQDILPPDLYSTWMSRDARDEFERVHGHGFVALSQGFHRALCRICR